MKKDEMTEKYDIGTWVVPLFRRAGDERSFAGTGFVTRDYLITAGHVLTGLDTIYGRAGDTYFEMKRDLWLPHGVEASDKLGWDVALFRINAPASPFTLSASDASKHDELEVICWQMRGGKPVQVTTRCLVVGEDEHTDGYFVVATTEGITHGASGCPVFRDGKVYGLLAMGRDTYELPAGVRGGSVEGRRLLERFGKNTCWVFKSSHALRFVPQGANR